MPRNLHISPDTSDQVLRLRDQATDLFRALVGVDGETPIVRAEFAPDFYRITYLTSTGERTDTVYWSMMMKVMGA